MEYLRHIDDAKFKAAPDSLRYNEWLLDHTNGASPEHFSASLNWVRTPPGSGSPAGLHTHAQDQIFYIVSGVMTIEIEGRRYEAGPNSIFLFPKEVPHRNWNAGTEPIVHLAVNIPMPDPNAVLSRPYEEPAKA